MHVRRATIADVSGVASGQIQSWCETYRGIVPDEQLANLSEEDRRQTWTHAFGDQGDHDPGLHVAQTEVGEIVDIANGGTCRTPTLSGSDRTFSGELFCLYLLKAHQGQGIGRTLFERVASDLQAQGHASMMLWVLEENPAVGFYRKQGGVRVAEQWIEIGGKKLKATALAWSF